MPTSRGLDLYLRGAASPEVAAVLAALSGAAAGLSGRIRRGRLDGPLGATAGTNADGDSQRSLDVIADAAFADALKGTPVRWLASEERDGVVALDPHGTLAVAIDPLDGSSNIDVNISVGTIFSVRTAQDEGLASFLRPGREQLAAGYFIYGPQTELVLTVGTGTAMFLLDPETGLFQAGHGDARIPTVTREFSVNDSNMRHWHGPVRSYVDECLAGAAGGRGKDFNMRWVGSLVAEAHRILTRGGIFLYPGDRREGYERGRLRMAYECAAIAMLVEQAGGIATDGRLNILDQAPGTLHARTPFVFGAAEEVARVAAYHDLPGREASPLFGHRGLFSAGDAP